tara:strand:- start:106 stop:525 length:420 start_codon:yes stop_codon:yes gene_type:complete
MTNPYGEKKTRTTKKRRTSSRTSRIVRKDSFAQVDDECRIANIKQTASPLTTFAKCIPISVNSLVKDLVNSEAMLGDTTTEKLYNALTINDRLVYAIAVLLCTIIILLTIKVLFSRQTLSDEELRWKYFGLGAMSSRGD